MKPNTEKRTATRKARTAPSIGKVLLYMAAIYQATQYMRAGAMMDGGMGVLDFGAFRIPLGQIGGLFAGLTVNLSLAYAATRLPSINGQKREKFAKLGFYGLLLISPLLIGPVNYVLMDERVLNGFWYFRLTLAILWASAMDIAIALVGIIDKSLMSLGSDAGQRSATVDGRPATNERHSKSQGAKGSNAEAIPAAILRRCECGFTTVNRFIYSGHQGKCAVHKQAKSGQPIPVDLTRTTEKARL